MKWILKWLMIFIHARGPYPETLPSKKTVHRAEILRNMDAKREWYKLWYNDEVYPLSILTYDDYNKRIRDIQKDVLYYRE